MYQAKLSFKETAAPKIGSLRNIDHRPGGGDRKVTIYRLKCSPSTVNGIIQTLYFATKI